MAHFRLLFLWLVVGAGGSAAETTLASGNAMAQQAFDTYDDKECFTLLTPEVIGDNAKAHLLRGAALRGLSRYDEALTAIGRPTLNLDSTPCVYSTRHSGTKCDSGAPCAWSQDIQRNRLDPRQGTS